MGKLYYIGYYSDKHDKCRQTTPAADTKMSYIIEVAQRIGYQVEVLSMCGVDERQSVLKKHKGYCVEDDGTKVNFFDFYDSNNKCIRVVGRFISRKKIKQYLKKNINKEDCVLIYHSLALMYIYALVKRLSKKVILEVEEIYSDVIGDMKEKNRELKSFQKADAFIFPTILLSDVINQEKKPEVLIHGTYRVEPDRICRNDIWKQYNANPDDIHCVYAGTFDHRKGGAIAAATAAEFLPSNYHIHILGFGNEEDTTKMKEMVANLAKRCECTITYDGLISGDEYIRFIQSCDIGLSTQNPIAAFNSTSFPSKILSYLSNGLRVVSIKIPAIETSAIGDSMYYYEDQTPMKIADAILRVDVNETFDSRKLIEQLDTDFKIEFENLLQ